MGADKRFKTKGDARFKKPTAALRVQDDERFAKRFTDPAFREGARVDPRGRTREEDAEISSESSDSDSDEIDIDDRVWEAPDHTAVRNDDTSKRLCFMGLDWNSISAEDILGVCRSSATKPEEVHKAMIFPSEIGKKMLEKEAMEGPQLEQEGEDPEETIRKYNRERSTYFYGIVFCDNAKVAEAIYDELDGVGVPYLCAGCPLDVRFVPDDLEFPHNPVSEASKISRTYEAYNEAAHTRAGLAHTKALCHWDEDDPKRKKDLMKKMSKKEMEENDLHAYLASESEDENAAEKRKLLLGDCAESGSNDGDGPGSDFFEDNDAESENGEKTATFYPEMDKIVEEVQEKVKVEEAGGNTKKSTWDSYLERRKLKKKERRQNARQRGAAAPSDDANVADSADATELELLMHEGGHDRDFNLKRKRQTPDESGFKENVADERLQRMFDDPDFALDPTHPSFKKSKTMDKFLEKTRRRKKKAKIHADAASIPAPQKVDMQMFG